MSSNHHDFRLGPAMLKSPGVPHAPDTWRDALLRALDSKSAARLAQSSPAALDWVVSEWPGDVYLTIRVQASSAEWPEQVLRRLTRARQQLEKRGSQSVTLALAQKGLMDKGDTASLHTALAALGAGLSMPNLTLSLKFQYITRGLLSFAAQAFSALQSLHIESPNISEGEEMQLPPPSVFPDLQHLSIGRVPEVSQEDVYLLSLTRYLPQLTSLTLTDETFSVNWPFNIIISRTPTFISNTLTTVTLGCALDNVWMARTLQRHAPALTTINARGIGWQEGRVDVAPVCTWRTVRVHSMDASHWFNSADVDWLPLPADGQLQLDLAGCGLALDLPLGDEVATKLPRWDIRGCGTLVLRFERTDQAPDTQPQLLREALQQLQSVQLSSPQLELQLMGLTVTPAMTAELHTLAASGWGKVSLHTPEWPQNGPAPTVPLPPLHTLQLKDKLTDTLLVQLQQRLTSLQVLQVAGVALASALPAGARLPWRVIRVTGQCNLTTWPEQAELVGDGVEWELNTLGVSLTPDQVAAGADLPARLAKTRLTKLKSFYTTGQYNTYSPADQSGLLRATFALARALPCHADNLTISGWPASAPVIASLAHLPHWPGTLTLSLTSVKPPNGPDPNPWPISRAPWLIPRSYAQWNVEIGHPVGLSGQEIDAFLNNAPGDRTVEEPLKICYVGQYADVFAGGRREWEELVGTYPNVSIGVA